MRRSIKNASRRKRRKGFNPRRHTRRHEEKQTKEKHTDVCSCAFPFVSFRVSSWIKSFSAYVEQTLKKAARGRRRDASLRLLVRLALSPSPHAALRVREDREFPTCSRDDGRCSLSPSCEPWPRPHTPRCNTCCPSPRGSRTSLARTSSLESRPPSQATSSFVSSRSGIIWPKFQPATPRKSRQLRDSDCVLRIYG